MEKPNQSSITLNLSIDSINSTMIKPEFFASYDDKKEIKFGTKSITLKKFRSKIDELYKSTVSCILTKEVFFLMQEPSPFNSNKAPLANSFEHLLFVRLQNNQYPFISSADFIYAAFEIAANEDKFKKNTNSLFEQLPKIASTVSMTLDSESFVSSVSALCLELRKSLIL